LFGAIEFYQEATRAGIKPIIGCEAYIAPRSHKEKANSMREAAYHFTLLAENDTGYSNLVKLITTAHLDGFHYRPRIDKELLAQHSAGLIGLSGCLAGEVNSAIQANNIQKATAAAAEYRDILGAENFFIELHDHGMEEQKWCNAVLPKIAKDLGVRLVAANDVHFLTRDDHDAHDVMLCIGTGKMVQDENRMHYAPELYFKSPAEMRELFKEHPESVDKTGFFSYILIVWDFIHFAKGRGIPVGPGRGSAAGSLIAYVIGITDIDPLQFGLLFERFLNPDRISPPDIDVDFCEARRGEV